MTQRPGVTLIEVLVAIMITAIGLLALLTLFPLGALEMAQSIKDDRTGHIKHSAVAVANAWNIGNDPIVVKAMLNPGGGLPPLNPNNPSQANSPSYPVFVDPNGWWANTGAWQNWMAGQQGLLPPRVTFSLLSPTSPDTQFVSNVGHRQRQLLRWTTFLDDMTFPRDDPNGVPEGRPCIPSTGLVDRAPKYSWAYVMRRPKVAVSSVVATTVVVYSGRALNAPTTGENFYSAQFTPGPNLVTLSWGAGQTAPDVVNGGWIFDGTMTPNPHGYFYRIVSITQGSNGPNSMDVEVQTPLRSSGPGVVVVLDNVVEVFERP